MKMKKELLKAILESAKSAYPYEFVALLTGEKGIISELVFLPSISGEESALIHLEMLPLGLRVYGTVHSHPSPCCEPSEEDFFLFTKFGKVHVIVCYPFTMKDWKCFDSNGEEIKLELV
ncbi:MAG: peptidase [Archaeoglobi archaeon]|jgi:proteasome lid subunit RPN8/RPN11|nr:Mov34/MPN/PAD-1 family protein [Archaeoglobus sp.]NHW89224.1 peptidase [Archaeoglobales archaeon]TDA26833.1 MAG: peptidase [Archaeoglobi archaeon]TDA27937.1 MAG: peptidase [Archaeoglobi archaeon]